MRGRVAFSKAERRKHLTATIKFWEVAALKKRAGIASVGAGVR
jgi:hypothetical protein